MQYFKKILYRIIHPGVVLTIIFIAVSTVLLLYVFAFEHNDSLIAYLSYVLSTYTLVIVCCKIPVLVKGGKQSIYRNPYAKRYLTDVPYRVRVSLYGAFVINAAFALLKLVSGIVYRSVWFGAIAVYYMILCLIRFLLVDYVGKHDMENNKKGAYRIYRLCGILLLILNLALSGVTIQMVRKNQGYHYPGMLIYLAAIFTFYAVISAAVNLVKYRRYDSPIISATKAINFTTAIVSVLSLQTAMFAEFNGDPQFITYMNSATGSAVCLIILGTAFYMIAAATHRLWKYQCEEE